MTERCVEGHDVFSTVVRSYNNITNHDGRTLEKGLEHFVPYSSSMADQEGLSLLLFLSQT